jgi:hypothetical protein
LSKKKNILVCICIPTYNSEKTIKNTVLSILDQSYKNIIVKIVDNASNDKTLNLISSIKDKRLKIISLVIFNYVRKLAKDNSFDLKQCKEQESINLIPIFEYISHNNIELYDFSKLEMSDVDTSKNEDLERFVLTHVYYITQRA